MVYNKWKIERRVGMEKDKSHNRCPPPSFRGGGGEGREGGRAVHLLPFIPRFEAMARSLLRLLLYCFSGISLTLFIFLVSSVDTKGRVVCYSALLCEWGKQEWRRRRR
jgi:hypothetical protein